MNILYEIVTSFSYLPYGSFKILSEKETEVFDLDSIPKSLIGYILEVDLLYPTILYNLHNDYSLCPGKIEIGYDMLSNYCKDIADQYRIKVGGVKN